MMVDKVNGKMRINCIIMNIGVIPNFGGIMGPILDPRPIEVDEIRLLLKMGVDLRAVDRRDKKPDPKKALVLNDKVVDQLMDEFKNGKKDLHPHQHKKVEQPKQQQPKKVEEKKVEQPKPQQQPKKEVKQPEVKKDEIVETKEVKQPEQKQVNNKVNKK